MLGTLTESWSGRLKETVASLEVALPPQGDSLDQDEEWAEVVEVPDEIRHPPGEFSRGGSDQGFKELHGEGCYLTGGVRHGSGSVLVLACLVLSRWPFRLFRALPTTNPNAAQGKYK